MSTNDNGLDPSWNRPWDRVDDDWLTEDGTTEDVSNGSVWRQPHLLELKFLHSRLVGCDRGTLDGNLVLLGSLGRVDGNLIISCITVLDAQIVILEIDVQEGQDEFVPNLVPDDPLQEFNERSVI